MYYFVDSPTVLTDLPGDPNCSVAVTDDGKFVAMVVNNHIYFHCQKVKRLYFDIYFQTLTLIGQYRHKPQTVETSGNFVYIAWNSTSDILLVRVTLCFIKLNLI